MNNWYAENNKDHIDIREVSRSKDLVCTLRGKLAEQRSAEICTSHSRIVARNNEAVINGDSVIFEHDGFCLLGIYLDGNQIAAGTNIYASDYILPFDANYFDCIRKPWNEV